MENPIPFVGTVITLIKEIRSLFIRKFFIRFSLTTSSSKLLFNGSLMTYTSHVVLVTLQDSFPCEIERVSIWDNEKNEFALLEIQMAKDFIKINPSNSPITIEVAIPEAAILPISRILIRSSTGKTYYSNRYPKLPPIS